MDSSTSGWVGGGGAGLRGLWGSGGCRKTPERHSLAAEPHSLFLVVEIAIGLDPDETRVVNGRYTGTC